VRTRILWLILLSVTVTALPVSARSAAKSEKQDKAAPASPAKDSKQDQQTPKKIHISSAVDLWDGGSARILTGGISLVSIPVLLGGHTNYHLAPTESWPHATVSALSFPQATQHHWLTCRYAHAPPFIG